MTIGPSPIKRAIPLTVEFVDGKKVVDTLVNENLTHYLFDKSGKVERKAVKNIFPFGRPQKREEAPKEQPKVKKK